MIHLIGTHHKFQIAGVVPNDEFLTYLSKAVIEMKATVLAEEMNADGEKILGGPEGKSIATIVAERFKIQHLYCDPNKAERKTLGIRSDSDIMEQAMSAWFISDENPNIVADRERRKDFPVREGFWLQKLRPYLAAPSIVFVCGADHIETFKVLLVSDSNNVSIHCREWTDSSS